MSLRAMLDPPRRRAASMVAAGALDPTGASGLTAALSGVSALGVHGFPVATAVRDLTPLPQRLVVDALHAALAAGPVDAVLLGDPGRAGHAHAMAEVLEAFGPWVVDPDLADAHGEPRHARDVADAVRSVWLPHTEVLVVDAFEAAILTGRPVYDRAGMREAGKRLFDTGARWIVLTSGAIEGHAIDLAYDGADFIEFGADRRREPDLVAAGAVFAGALAAALATGREVLPAVELAKATVTAAIDAAALVGDTMRASPLAPALRAMDVELTPIELPPPPDETD